MNQIEEAYLLGQQHYEMHLLQQLEAAQHLEAAQYGELEQHAALLEHAAHAEAQLVQHGYLSAMAEYEAALTAAHHAALAAPGPSREQLEQEEAYQIGVTLTEAQNLVRHLEKSASELSGDLKKAFDQGCEHCRAALEGPKAAEDSGKSKRGR